MKKKIFTIALLGLLFGIGYSAIQAAPTTQVETRSGCCSHHGGVAYHIAVSMVTTFAMTVHKVLAALADKIFINFEV